MSVVNGPALLANAPIKMMALEKHRDKQGVSYGLAEVGYDIRIKQSVCFFPGHSMGSIQIDCPRDGLIIDDGNFCLASAIEEFDMPPDMMGIVHDKSTWARCGLSVFNTVIEPGWKGFLTLELVYHGRRPLIIAAGTGIAQVVFHRLEIPAHYKGSYQDQRNQPVPSILHQV